MRSLLLLPLLFLPACRGTSSYVDTGAEAAPEDLDRIAVEEVLDDFHRAASEADGERYFSHLAPEAVFLGTDATERWTKAEFEQYARPWFSQGRGWTYRMTERHVHLGPDGRTAWFDERLWNDKYGDCRGTGALVRSDGRWRITQYNLTFPVPNEISAEVVRLIQEHSGSAR